MKLVPYKAAPKAKPNSQLVQTPWDDGSFPDTTVPGAAQPDR